MDEEYSRFFLFTYTTRISVGNIKVAMKDDSFPNEQWLINEVIPNAAPYLKSGSYHVVITGFTEFKSAADFFAFADGYNLDNAISNLFK